MPDSPKNENQEKQSTGIDLSELQNLNFGPDWSSKSSSQTSRKSRSSHRDESSAPKGKSNFRKDRRPQRPSNRDSAGGPRSFSQGENRSGDSRGPRRNDRRSNDQRRGHQSHDNREAFFKPTVEVLFYPEDVPFRALSQAIRRYCKTYELFEIAKLILEKSDRYVVVLKTKAKPGDKGSNFYISAPDGAPFESEDEAIGHVLKNHLGQFFNIEEIETDPPKGSFPAVNRCGMTGELLGPPNYHLYQALVQEHHSTKIPNVPFAKFESKIEAVRDEAVVNEWLQKMTKITRYTYKESKEGETDTFDNLEGARKFLLNRCKDKIVIEKDQTRLSGSTVSNLPTGNIRRSIETVLENQRRFPLDTANNLRGRLRRMKFTIYKKGSKGVSFVCSVKRKFRTEKTVFSEHINNLIQFIEKNPNTKVDEIPEKYLGITNAEVGVVQNPVETAPTLEVENTTESAKPVSETATTTETTTAESEADEPKAEASKPEAKPAAEPTPIANVADANISEADKEKLHKTMVALRWLVTEGYVSEFADGSLFAPAVLTTPPPKESEESDTKGSTEQKATEPTVEAEAPATEGKPTEIEAESSVEPKVEKAPETTQKPAAEVNGETANDSPASEEQEKQPQA